MQRSFQQEAMTAVAASTDGTYIAAGGVSGSIYIWTAADGCLVMVWPAHFKVQTLCPFQAVAQQRCRSLQCADHHVT